MRDGASADGRQLLRLILDALSMRELSVAEQRYLAVLAVIGEGHPVSSVAQQWGVSRQTVHAWLSRDENGGPAGLGGPAAPPASGPPPKAGGGGGGGGGAGG